MCGEFPTIAALGGDQRHPKNNRHETLRSLWAIGAGGTRSPKSSAPLPPHNERRTSFVGKEAYGTCHVAAKWTLSPHKPALREKARRKRSRTIESNFGVLTCTI
jgi:hypothetical protein